jgi:hypothetical protein
MSKSAVRLCFSLLLLLATVISVEPKLAEAACFYPKSVETTYYAWIDNTDPTWYSCAQPIISPCCAGYLHWGPIGGTFRDCDGNVSSWGDTTTCTGPANTERNFGYCDPICE